MIVRYFASEWCMTSLFQKGKIYGMWRFSLSFIVSSCTTKPLSSQFWLDNAEENVAYLVLVQWWGDDRQVSQSGKPLCTGTSLWAVPKLARGLCPLEPWHANGGNSVLEISTGYFFSDCHGLAKTLSCIYQRGTLHIPLWNLLLI